MIFINSEFNESTFPNGIQSNKRHTHTSQCKESILHLQTFHFPLMCLLLFTFTLFLVLMQFTFTFLLMLMQFTFTFLLVLMPFTFSLLLVLMPFTFTLLIMLE